MFGLCGIWELFEIEDGIFMKYSDNETYENCCVRLLASLCFSQLKFIVFYSFLILFHTCYSLESVTLDLP